MCNMNYELNTTLPNILISKSKPSGQAVHAS